MCGIIGYSGSEDAKKIIIKGLTALEYRGYDSAGLTVFCGDRLQTVKTAGRVKNLCAKTAERITEKTFAGIGHTRWATHGSATEANAHPHGNDTLMLVHNGIIENYMELKQELVADGYRFRSQTDTEVIAALITKEYNSSSDPIKAVRSACKRLHGSFAIAVVFAEHKNTVYATAVSSPLLIGRGKTGSFIASDLSAFAEYADEFLRLSDGETALITADSLCIIDHKGKEKQPCFRKTEKSHIVQHKNGFDNFMLKEIHDEPEAIRATLISVTKNGLPDFSHSVSDDFLINIGRIHITACGTAFYAGLLGKYFIEKLAKIPVNAEVASEFRYNDPITSKNDIAIIISQSGETADSLAALRLMNKRNVKTLSVVNTPSSTMENESDCIIRTLAGAEVSVASTKAFHVQMLVLLMTAVKLAIVNGSITESQAREITSSASDIYSHLIPSVLGRSDDLRKTAAALSKSDNVFFIGRGADSILAHEAALKLKEISYINAQGYPAGELKHGTISLIEKNTPVIAIATDSFYYGKMQSNIEEVRSRGAYVIAVCPKNAHDIINISHDAILLPEASPLTLPFAAATALQILACHTADIMKRDIDKPRNLAKSVTVE